LLHRVRCRDYRNGMTLTAHQLLNAIDGGDLESIRADGIITVLIDLRPVLTIPVDPMSPKLSIRVLADHSVVISVDDIEHARIQADDADDARQIAGALRDLVGAAK
jgi:hypothetical protein